MADNNAITQVKPTGRPTVMTADTITKLESVFKLGVSDEVACNYAGIGTRTYYDHLKVDDVFRSKMMSAKHYSRLAAGNVVMDDIVKNKNVDTAKWWLEHKNPQEFRTKPKEEEKPNQFQFNQFNIGGLTDEQRQRRIAEIEARIAELETGGNH